MATMQELTDGFAVLSKYETKGMLAHIGGSEHDIIFGSTAIPASIDPTDIQKLDDAGWHWSTEFDCWCHFT